MWYKLGVNCLRTIHALLDKIKADLILNDCETCYIEIIEMSKHSCDMKA